MKQFFFTFYKRLFIHYSIILQTLSNRTTQYNTQLYRDISYN